MKLGYLSTLKTVGTFTRTSGTVVTITALTTTANIHFTVTFKGNSSDGGSTAAQSANTTTAVTLNG